MTPVYDPKTQASSNFFTWLDSVGWKGDQAVRSVSEELTDDSGAHHIITGKKPAGQYKIYKDGTVQPLKGAQVQLQK